MIGARIVSNLVASKHDEKKSGNRLLVVYPSVPVPVPPQHPKRPAASGCRSGQRGGFFLEAAVNPGGISGRYPPSRLRRLPGAATTNRTMSPTPAPAAARSSRRWWWCGTGRPPGTPPASSRSVVPSRFFAVLQLDWLQGQMDPELNEIGRQQAVVVARRLSKEAKPAAISSSDLKRTAETAEIIAKVCDVSNLVLNEALRERHMGYLQGLKWDDAVNKNPDVFRGFDIFKITEGSDPDSRNQEISGGGESLNQLTERCVSYLNKIAQEHIGQWILERCGDVSHLDGNGFLENSFGGDGASA